MEIENKKRWLFVLLQILLGATVFSWLIPVVEAFPQDKFQEKHPDDTTLPKNGLQESYFDDVTQSYDEFGMPIRTLSTNVVKFHENSRENEEHEDRENDPFKPKSGHVPGGLPMISDSAFSLTILIYVSVAFLLVFFLFCWKTNGNGTAGSSEETLKQQCPLMTNNPPEPKIIPPTPTKMIEDFE